MDEIKNKNPNWKQWIPVYGFYQAGWDFAYKRPSVLDLNNHPILFGISVGYQSIVTPATIFLALSTLEKLLK